MEKYDYLVIGSGPAGYTSAIRAAQLGLKVAVCEKDEKMFGGVCLNEGCIPAKSLYRSAEIIDIVRKSPELCGIEMKYKCADMIEMVKKSRECADQLSQGLLFLFKKNKIDLINGEAVFLDNKKVQIKDKEGYTFEVEAEKFLIATGSAPKALPEVPFDGKSVLNSSQAIRLEKIPESILIIGGGAIGVEFASFFNLLDVEVTIVEALDSLLPLEDREVTKRFQSTYKRRGVNVYASSTIKEAKPQKGSVSVVISGPEGEAKETFEKMLVAAGRQPVTEGLALEKAGVKADEKGYIPVDAKMKTNIENIYAAGDCVKTPMLAHVASAEGEIAAEAAAGKDPEPIDYSAVPNAIYSDVQLASVGITEEKAKEDKLNYKAGKQYFKGNGKAVISAQTEGLIKVIADADTHKLLGAHILGHLATELIPEFALAKRAGLKIEDIEKTVHAHPTFSEAAIDACKAVFEKPIHG
ncbi:MAG: dihydrolipoyl dehydrogenase [Candidatus Omnitrophota bacterium]|jgi:dihydrolipoamide dehydrogenase